MSDLDDERIRAAYEAIAATAPPPERVRARILARGRAQYQRRVLLVGAGALGAAAAATAVGVPLLSNRTPTRHVPSLVGTDPPWGSAPISAMPTASPVLRVPLRFAPTWLPDGLGEQFRQVKTAGAGEPRGSTRSWLPVGTPYPEDHTGPAGVSLAVDERIDDNSGEPVMIGSVEGRLRVSDSASVEWQPPGGPSMIVMVYQLPNQVDVALRVARSVAATTAALTVTMRSPWVPDRFAGYTVATVHPTSDGWYEALTYASTDLHNSCMVSVESSGRPRAAAGGGRQPLTVEEAARMTAELLYGPPDLSWVGGR
ncbi:hypothetical protein [Dactylosporangium darangshiense]|uniref:Uncharacterized protein n=1 Tax=Dactylosporangium darangshiense TaxID=579108 RepID=A0ABP8DLC7_9ACTN